MIILELKGMESEDCVEVLTDAVRTLDPDVKVKVSLRAKTVTINETDIAAEDFAEVIEDAGYEVEGCTTE